MRVAILAMFSCIVVATPSVAQAPHAVPPRESLDALLQEMHRCHDLNDYEQAMAIALKVVAIDRKNVEGYAELGFCRSHAGSYKQAVIDCTKVLSLDKNNLLALNTRAYSNLKLGRYAEGIQDYNLLLKIDPNNMQAYFNRSKAYLKIDRPDLAARDMEVVEKAGLKDDSQDINQSPLDFIKQGRADVALSQYNSEIKLHPSAALYRLRADLYMLVSAWREAIDDYTSSLKIDNMPIKNRPVKQEKVVSEQYAESLTVDAPVNNPKHCLLNRARAYANLGRAKDVINDCTLALDKLKIEDYDFFLVRGQAYESDGQYKNAIADYSKILQVEPHDALTCLWRAHCHMCLNDWKMALSDCNRALEIDSALSDGYVTRAEIEEAMGKSEVAAASLSEAIKLYPLEPDLVEKRADLLKRARQFDRAIGDYNLAAQLSQGETVSILSSRQACFAAKGDNTSANKDRLALKELIRHPRVKGGLPPLPVKEF